MCICVSVCVSVFFSSLNRGTEKHNGIMNRSSNNLTERDPDPAITLSMRKAQKLISVEVNGVGSMFK